MSSLRDLTRRTRQSLGALVMKGVFEGGPRAARLNPLTLRAIDRAAEIREDVPYLEGASPEHTLDVWRPRGRTGPLPVVLYLHGGGFCMLSSKTHWMIAQQFVERGYLVFNANYRLAPRHPFPAAVEDACAAYQYVARHAADHGGDPSRLVLAGESAGANLVAALMVASSYERPEPWARAVYDCPVRPRVALPACGILQVTDVERLRRRRPLPELLFDRIVSVPQAYLARAHRDGPGGLDLADPLCVLEREAPTRPLPATFAIVGTRDPLLDDTRRLGAALERHGAVHLERYYPGELHAFHAMTWRPQARQSWEETFDFLRLHG
jgi:acetyl esterase